MARGDVDGYRSYMRTQYQKHAARILKTELGHYRTGATPAAAAATPAAVPVGSAAPAVRTEAGWNTLNRRLTPQEYSNIDLEKTNRQMMAEGKAIMKNGSRVAFKR